MKSSNIGTTFVLRRKQVEAITGLSRSTLYEHIKTGSFPKPIQLTSKRCVGWLSEEVQSYIQARIAARDLANGGA